jgi:hypothetical protein
MFLVSQSLRDLFPALATILDLIYYSIYFEIFDNKNGGKIKTQYKKCFFMLGALAHNCNPSY